MIHYLFIIYSFNMQDFKIELLSEIIAKTVETYKSRKMRNASSYDDIIADDILQNMSLEEKNKIIQQLNNNK